MGVGRLFSAPWDHFIVVEATRHLKYKDARCRYCNQLIQKVQPSRHLKNHNLKCKLMPAEIRDEYMGRDLMVKRLKTGRTGMPLPAEVENARSTGASSVLLTAEDKKRFRMQAAKAFYTNGWAFRSIEDPAVRDLLARNCPVEFLPTRQQLSDDLLIETFGLEKAELIEFLLNQGYVALVTDGWSNSRRESFINFILVGPNMRPLLWTCRVTGEDIKTGPYMANMIAEVIAEVEEVIGAGKVVAVTTDNASAMKSAWAILRDICPGLMATGGTAHTLGLLMKDVLCDPDLAEVLTQAQEVANFVRNHTATNARFSAALRSSGNIDNRRSLKIPIATRWYSQYECVKLVVESERMIRDLALDSVLLAKYKSAKVHSFEKIVLSERSWVMGEMTLKLLDPIHKCIAHFEKDSLCLSVIYQQFVELQQHPVYNDDIPGIEQDMQAMFREKIQNRWEFIESSPMRIAYLLDHTTDGALFTTAQQNKTVADIERLAARLQYTSTQAQQLRKELGKFMEAKRKWDGATKRSYFADSPMTWWSWIGVKDYPLLTTIAQRIFTIPASSAAAERSWSVFKFRHSAQRNRLSNERLIKLVFIYSKHGSKKAASDVVAVTLSGLDPGPNESSPPQRCDDQLLPVSTATSSEFSEAIHPPTPTSNMVQVGVMEDTGTQELDEQHRDWADDNDQYGSVEWWGNIDPNIEYLLRL